MLSPISKVAFNTLGYMKPRVKSFLAMPKSPLELVSGVLTGVVISFAIAKSPSLWLGLDEVSKRLHHSAVPTIPQNEIVSSQQQIPEEIKTFLWSKEGLNQKNIMQYKGNCQIIANVIAATFTDEGLKKLESLIEVADYNLDKNNFYVNFTVNINGKKIPVQYRDLINSSSFFYSKDPHAPHVLAYAIEKELSENYLPNPGGYTSESTATFITNKNYSINILPVMSDASLIDILKNAPNEIVTVGTYPEDNMLKIFTGVYNPFQTNSSNKNITLSHEYAVKDYKYKNGQHLVTLAASNEEVTITLDELRANILTITAPAKTFNFFDLRTAETYLISLLTLIALKGTISGLEHNKKLKKQNA